MKLFIFLFLFGLIFGIFFIFLITNKNSLLFPQIPLVIQDEVNFSGNENFFVQNCPSDDMVTIYYPGRKLYPFHHNKKNFKNIIIVNYRSLIYYKQRFGNMELAKKNGIDAYRLASTKFKKIRVVVYSIGNAVFSEIYSEIFAKKYTPPFEIINIAGVIDMKDLLKHYTGLLSIPLFFPFLKEFQVKENYEKYLQSPFYMIYSTHDEIIPFSFAKKMYEELRAMNKKITFRTVTNIKHTQFDTFQYLTMT